MDNRHIVIFDGVCNVCNSAVKFVIKRDPAGVFAFTPMQSDLARQLLEGYPIDTVNIETVALLKNGQVFTYSDAWLEITKDLAGLWSLLRVFSIVPAPIRDYLYRLFARNRYRLFGRTEECMVPTPKLKARFFVD